MCVHSTCDLAGGSRRPRARAMLACNHPVGIRASAAREWPPAACREVPPRLVGPWPAVAMARRGRRPLGAGTSMLSARMGGCSGATPSSSAPPPKARSAQSSSEPVMPSAGVRVRLGRRPRAGPWRVLSAAGVRRAAPGRRASPLAPASRGGADAVSLLAVGAVAVMVGERDRKPSGAASMPSSALSMALGEMDATWRASTSSGRFARRAAT